jgi:hypothetical protein
VMAWVRAQKISPLLLACDLSRRWSNSTDKQHNTKAYTHSSPLIRCHHIPDMENNAALRHTQSGALMMAPPSGDACALRLTRVCQSPGRPARAATRWPRHAASAGPPPVAPCCSTAAWRDARDTAAAVPAPSARLPHPAPNPSLRSERRQRGLGGRNTAAAGQVEIDDNTCPTLVNVSIHPAWFRAYTLCSTRRVLPDRLSLQHAERQRLVGFVLSSGRQRNARIVGQSGGGQRRLPWGNK